MDTAFKNADNDDVGNPRSASDSYTSVPYGFQSLGSYSHASKNCEIKAITCNTKSNENIILDSRGVTSWVKNIAVNATKRLFDFDAYKFNVIRDIIYCKSYNVYFALSKEYKLKAFNMTFQELYSQESDGSHVSCLLLNLKRKELISVGRSKLRFWSYMKGNDDKISQGFILNREYDVLDSSLVSNAVFDEELQRLYLICDYDICCYNVYGQLLFSLKTSGSAYLSVCAFSKKANLMVTGSMNGEINVYNPNGGLVITFCSHSNLITALLIHPSDGNMFISSSMDGTVKLFSLNMLEELYSINIFSDGIYWMGLKRNNMLYCASRKSVQLFDLNYSFTFWSTVRSPVKELFISLYEDSKSSHVVACGTDNSIRMYRRRNGQKRSTILPPPELSVSGEVLSVAYDRLGCIIYLLFSHTELWIYSLRTDPATRVAVWNVQTIVRARSSTGKNDRCQEITEQGDVFVKRSFGLNQIDENVKCHCLATKPKQFHEKNTLDMQIFSHLLCGLSNGAVYFLDPAIAGYVYTTFKAHPTSPVTRIDIIKDSSVTQLSTLIETLDGLLIRIWDASNLLLLHEFPLCENYNVYCCQISLFAVGCDNGMLDIKRYNQLGCNRTFQIKDYQSYHEEYATKDHADCILNVDILKSKEIVCTCGKDNFVRIWNCEKVLLSEIKFDQSLCYSIFLDSSGTVLISFKSQLFVIPHHVLNIPKIYLNSESSESCDNESFIYEDPYVKKEFRRQPIEKDTTLENYLVPYPHLNLELLWMFQNLLEEEENKQTTECSTTDTSEEESEISSIYAATEIYEDSLYSGVSRTNSIVIDFPHYEGSMSPMTSEDELSLGGDSQPEVVEMEKKPISEQDSLTFNIADRIRNLQKASKLALQVKPRDDKTKSQKLKKQPKPERSPQNRFGDTPWQKRKIKKKTKKKKHAKNLMTGTKIHGPKIGYTTDAKENGNSLQEPEESSLTQEENHSAAVSKVSSMSSVSPIFMLSTWEQKSEQSEDGKLAGQGHQQENLESTISTVLANLAAANAAALSKVNSSMLNLSTGNTLAQGVPVKLAVDSSMLNVSTGNTLAQGIHAGNESQQDKEKTISAIKMAFLNEINLNNSLSVSRASNQDGSVSRSYKNVMDSLVKSNSGTINDDYFSESSDNDNFVKFETIDVKRSSKHSTRKVLHNHREDREVRRKTKTYSSKKSTVKTNNLMFQTSYSTYDNPLIGTDSKKKQLKYTNTSSSPASVSPQHQTSSADIKLKRNTLTSTDKLSRYFNSLEKEADLSQNEDRYISPNGHDEDVSINHENVHAGQYSTIDIDRIRHLKERRLSINNNNQPSTAVPSTDKLKKRLLKLSLPSVSPVKSGNDLETNKAIKSAELIDKKNLSDQHNAEMTKEHDKLENEKLRNFRNTAKALILLKSKIRNRNKNEKRGDNRRISSGSGTSDVINMVSKINNAVHKNNTEVIQAPSPDDAKSDDTFDDRKFYDDVIVHTPAVPQWFPGKRYSDQQSPAIDEHMQHLNDLNVKANTYPTNEKISFSIAKSDAHIGERERLTKFVTGHHFRKEKTSYRKYRSDRSSIVEVPSAETDDANQNIFIDIRNSTKELKSDAGISIAPRKSPPSKSPPSKSLYSTSYQPATHVKFHTVAENQSNTVLNGDKLNSTLFQKLRERQEFQEKSRKRQTDARMNQSFLSARDTSPLLMLPNQKKYNSDPVKVSRERLSVSISPLHNAGQRNASPELDIYSFIPQKPIAAANRASSIAERQVRIRNLEEKLSGQLHRFHLVKTNEENESNRVVLAFLRAKEQGIDLLPVEKSSISIPNRPEYRLIKQIKKEIPRKLHFGKTYPVTNGT